jgi:hypothetical protein
MNTEELLADATAYRVDEDASAVSVVKANLMVLLEKVKESKI